jgi:hypothetical protein
MKLSGAEREILMSLRDGKPLPTFRPDDETPYALRIKRLAMHDLLEFTGIKQDELAPALSKKGRKLAAGLD